MAEENEPKLFLELGQVIQIQAPTDPTLHENIYLINYLDSNLIKLINNEDLSEKVLKIRNPGNLVFFFFRAPTPLGGCT